MKNRHIALRILACLCWLVMIVALMFAVLRSQLKRQTFFPFYMVYDTQRRIGISPEDSTNAAMALVDYMEGRRDSIQLTVTENGREVEMYNQREIDHMADVKKLYQGFARLLPASLIAAVVLLLCRLAAGRAGEKGFLCRTYLWALVVFALILACMGAWALLNFTAFWTAFHHAFFTNDLWLLNPATDRMIRICPESLFSSLAGNMALKTAEILAMWGVGAAVVLIRKRSKKSRPA